MRQPEGNNFCYYPFFQILQAADGKYKPCSKHRDVITHKGEVLDTTNATLQDAWNSDYMQDMRQHFNSDKQFAGCAECWRMQKMGLRSMRYDSYQYKITEEQVANPVKPVRIELNSSNICNLKCRVCSPSASDKWLPEFQLFYNSAERVHYNLTGENLDQVKGWIDNLEEICFFGGEPLMNKENLNLIDSLVEKGRAPQVALLFNTNGTVFNDRLAGLLGQFKRVRISFSIDDLGHRFEYQRHGAKWEQVEKNLAKAYHYSQQPEWQNVEFKICCTLSSLNAYYMPEFFDYFGKHYPGLVIYWNLIYDPPYFSVQLLPRPVKELIKKRWREGITPTFALTSDETKTVEDIITYLDHDVEGSFDTFFEFINRHDIYRKESFPQLFAEFWSHIEAYKPADLVMGQYEDHDLWKIPDLWQQNYNAQIDYSEQVQASLNKFLKANFTEKEAAGYLKEFNKRITEIVASSPQQIDTNKLFYLMKFSKIKDVFWDVRKMSNDEMHVALSKHNLL
jgi:hypothetical protein